MLAPDVYARLHKGTPFYWLAWTAFVFHDYETAAFYIDAAVSEDLRRAPGTTSRPALLFFLIDVQDPKQALFEEVRTLRSRIDKEILRYNTRVGAASPPLEFSDLRLGLLEPALAQGKEHLRTLVTTFISFLLEWEHRSDLIDFRTLQGTAEPFFIHLFKGCVLFESLLKASQPQPQATMLGHLLREMHSRLNFSGNYLRISPFDFPTVVNDLASDDDTVRTACERTGRVRNSTGAIIEIVGKSGNCILILRFNAHCTKVTFPWPDYRVRRLLFLSGRKVRYVRHAVPDGVIIWKIGIEELLGDPQSRMIGETAKCWASLEIRSDSLHCLTKMINRHCPFSCCHHLPAR